MTDDQAARLLLAQAAELPDHVQAPVARLVERGRRIRRFRAAASVLTVGGLTAAAIALPSVLSGLPSQAGPGGGGQHGHWSVPWGSGPTASQLTRFRWSPLASSPLGARTNPVLAWTGHELLEIDATGQGPATGAAFDPATGRWHRVATTHANIGTAGAVSAWTGRQLFLTNGQSLKCTLPPTASNSQLTECGPTAGLYDPATNSWTTTPLPAPMRGLTLTAAVWTGRDIILAGYSVGRPGARTGVAAYDPGTRRWAMITPAGLAGHPSFGVAMVATPRRTLLWSLWSKATKTGQDSYSVQSGIDVLALGPGNRWRDVTGNWPQGKVVDGPVYGGGAVLIPPGQIWCGTCSHPFAEFPAVIADAATLARRQVTAGPLVAHPLDEPPLWLWNGAAALAANLRQVGPASGQLSAISQLAAYDPATRQWFTLPVPSGSPPMATSPVWAGREVLLLTATGQLLSFHR